MTSRFIFGLLIGVMMVQNGYAQKAKLDSVDIYISRLKPNSYSWVGSCWMPKVVLDHSAARLLDIANKTTSIRLFNNIKNANKALVINYLLKKLNNDTPPCLLYSMPLNTSDIEKYFDKHTLPDGSMVPDSSFIDCTYKFWKEKLTQ